MRSRGRATLGHAVIGVWSRVKKCARPGSNIVQKTPGSPGGPGHARPPQKSRETPPFRGMGRSRTRDPVTAHQETRKIACDLAMKPAEECFLLNVHSRAISGQIDLNRPHLPEIAVAPRAVLRGTRAR